jgi:hypothetical protein
MYRTSDEVSHRTAAIGIAPSQTWWWGMTFGLLFGLVGLGMLFSASNWSRFTCTRDEAGKGMCVYVEHHPFGEKATRWDVTTLRKARIDAHRLVIVFEGSERTLFDVENSTTQTERMRRVDEFVADSARPTLVIYDDDSVASPKLAAFIALFGVAILFGTNAKFPFRRLVLDERSGTARFERRAWLRWREELTIPIGEVAKIETRLASYEPERDDALTELRAFFLR